MKTYEITYLTVNEETADAATIKDILVANGAAIVSVHPWGTRRKLTYPIKKQDQAFYTTVIFDAETSAVAPINKALQLNANVLRSLVVEFVPGVFHRVAHEDTRPTNKSAEKTESVVTDAPIEIAEAVESNEVPAEVANEATNEEKPKKTTRKKVTKVETEALDEKIEELLNEDVTK